MKNYITPNPDGGISRTRIHSGTPEEESRWLAKTLFEISRTTDTTVPFNPAVHTREAIAAGISGHRALAVIAEVEDADIPTDRYFRSAWEWSD